MKDFTRSKQLFEEAQRYLPGGVDSPVRAFRAVGDVPVFIKRGARSRVYDEDGNEFIDYLASWGPLILGHSHPRIVKAVKRAMERGSSFGCPTELETTLARMVCEAVPSVEMVRFVNSGTEATMSAIRLARAFTRRSKIIKFAGCYHGHSDGLLAQAGSGMVTLAIPSSPGVPRSITSETIVATYNDLEGVTRIFHDLSTEIAAVIIEPIAGNMGVVLPERGFLEGLRDLTKQHQALLVFDEVITGFRVSYGGAQGPYGITPDLTCMGKIIGGGFPIGAYGGRRDIMEMMAPQGPVYQAGTLAGNPVAMTAGIETLRELKGRHIYLDLEMKTARLVQGIAEAADKSKVYVRIPRAGSMFTVFFSQDTPKDYETASKANTSLYAKFFHQLMSQGVYFPPSQFEATFVSTAHTEADILATIKAAAVAFDSMP